MAKLAILCSAAIFSLVFAGGVEAGTIQTRSYNTGRDVYYYTAGMPTPRYNRRVATASVDATEKFEPYHRYISCVPRTFLFRICTLCFCTDVPSVAVCWDYKGEKCAKTQKLVDQQNNAVNNDPNGVW
ncbi:uncharacterized protein LOC100679990 isoform X2 [Nasonia vitripennis]|uniref:Uncharacterized protein n=1 Tax=Nasonia vitripennis TaxID=7425 RepID=A0A7M7GD66_NASVI|nr:uncharacterized protein LOC100679990 isoform X2 [Nasonia vitripennis]